MELYYQVRFLQQEFKRGKLMREIPVVEIDLQAESVEEAMKEAEFLKDVNNPEIKYTCITARYNFKCDQFKYTVRI